MSLAKVEAEVALWRGRIGERIESLRHRRQTAEYQLVLIRQGQLDTATLDRMLVLIADIKAVDSDIAGMLRLDQAYQDKLAEAIAHASVSTASRPQRGRTRHAPVVPRRDATRKARVQPHADENPLFVRFHDLPSCVDHPAPLPVPVTVCDAASPVQSEAHHIADDIDRRAAATLRWSPWERRRHVTRRYEGFDKKSGLIGGQA
jgi:hypothetical protein